MARSNGEGTITRRKNGTYQAAWFETVNGQRKRRYVYGKTSEDVRRKLRTALDRVDKGLPGIDSSDTFKAAGEAWRTGVARTSGLSLKTQSVYADVLRLHVYPVIGGERLRKLTPSRIASVLVVMDDKGLSKAYQHNAHKAMSAVFKAAQADGLVAANPVLSVKAPRGGHKAAVVPDREQVAALLKAAPDGRMRALIGVLAYTGVRISEALSIEWSDVREDSISIRRGKGRNGGKSRAVPLTPALAAILKEWRQEQRRERLAAVWWDDEHDWVLSSDCGTQWDAHNARKRFKPLADGVESDDPTKARPAICPGATPHSLRHATATLLLEEGVSMKVVAELLGHSSTRITEDTYSHVTARLVAEAANAITRALG